MTLTQNHLLEQAEVAIDAALQAGIIIQSYLDKDVEVKEKANKESIASQVLTEIDLLCEEKIVSLLQESITKYDLALLTEETEDDSSRLDKDYFWCVDPIDGTLPFIEKVHGFSVSIALVTKTGHPVIGVIYDPLKDILYHAIDGYGAYRNRVSFLSNESDTELTLYADRSFETHPLYKETLHKVEEISALLNYKKFNVLVQGGGALNACWILENGSGCYFKFPKPGKGGGSLWDFAASSCIFNEMGKVAVDFSDNPMDLNRKHSTYMNHRGVLFASNQQLKDKIIDLYKEFVKTYDCLGKIE